MRVMPSRRAAAGINMAAPTRLKRGSENDVDR